MFRVLLYILTGIVTSLFLFPFNLPIPGTEINTKMILAVIGAGLFVYDRIREKENAVSRDFFILSLICVCISIWAFFVTVFNFTSDYAFATYFLSVWVWLGAAYAVVWIVRAVHGEETVETVGNYLTGVCVVQCLVAYLMTVYPALGGFVDGLMGEGDAFMSATENRMHGLGAALDPAGLRFAGVLVVIGFLMGRTDFDEKPWRGLLYLISFSIITIIGNMIARSTTIGVVGAVIVFAILKWPRGGEVAFGKAWGILAGGLLVLVFFSIWLYNVSPSFRENLRFGFEGFFSLAEKGRWEVRSNEILKGMVVWPETVKTWTVGDGFFDNPQDLPDRFGRVAAGFYMMTDIGYLRYIFYFGVIGLVGMIAVFVQMTLSCIRHLKGYGILFMMLLVVNLAGWFKVSSDIIMVFAPFLIMAFRQVSCESSTA